MSTQRNKVHHVHTVAWVARKLDVDEDLTHDLTLGMEPEDGVIWVYGVDSDDGVMAFTDEGIEEVRLILEEDRESAGATRQPSDVSAASPEGYGSLLDREPSTELTVLELPMALSK